MAGDSLERELEDRVDTLGYELVEVERAGSRSRPVLRLRIDRPAPESGVGPAPPGQGVTVEDCARVSRAIEAYLDERGDLGERYVLEVSSPGIERPLVRRRDWERFTGREVAVKGREPLAGRSRRLEGELLGLVAADGEERVRLRLSDGEVVEVPRGQIERAHLIHRWDDGI